MFAPVKIGLALTAGLAVAIFANHPAAQTAPPVTKANIQEPQAVKASALLRAAGFIFHGREVWTAVGVDRATSGYTVIAATNEPCVFQTWKGDPDTPRPGDARDFAQINLRKFTRYDIRPNNTGIYGYGSGSLLVLDVEGGEGFYCTGGGTGNADPISPSNPVSARDCQGGDNSLQVRSRDPEELGRRVAALAYVSKNFCPPTNARPY